MNENSLLKYSKLFVFLFFLSGFLSSGFMDKNFSVFMIFPFLLFISLTSISFPNITILLYLVFVLMSVIFSPFYPFIDGIAAEILSVLFFSFCLYLCKKEEFYLFFERIIMAFTIFIFIDMLLNKFYNISFLFTSRNQNYQSFFYVVMYGFLIKKRFSKILFLGIIFLWLGVFVSNSRSGILAFFLMSFLRVFKLKDKGTRYIMFILFFAIVYLLFNFNRIAKISDPNSYKRIDIYLSALKSVIVMPLTGYGAGSFEAVFEIFKFPNFDGVSFYNHSAIHAHSHLLNVMSESGVFAGVLLVIIVLNALRGREFYSVVGGVVFFLFDTIFYNPFIRIIFFGVLALSFQENRSFLNIKPLYTIFPLFIIALFFVFNKNNLDLRLYYNAYTEVFSAKS